MGHTEEGRWISGYTKAVVGSTHLLHILLASAGCEAAGRGVHVIASPRGHLETAAVLLWVESWQDQEKRKQNCSLAAKLLGAEGGYQTREQCKVMG